MEKIKIGDIVARKSHNLDILFSVERIIRISNGREIAILKGITIRIVADSYLEDLIILDNNKINESLRSLDVKIEDRINNFFSKRLLFFFYSIFFVSNNNFFGCFRKSTISINSFFSSSKPATSLNVTFVFLSVSS